MTLEKLKTAQMDSIVDKLSEFIKSQVSKYEKNGVLLGISGGIDSALTAKIACIALGPDKIKALVLPDKDSDQNTVKDALDLASHLGIKDIEVIDITKKLEAFDTYSLLPELYAFETREERGIFIKNALQNFKESPDILEDYRGGQNTLLNKVRATWTSKVRMRMLTLYFHAEQNNLLVLGTTNKTELEAGWFTKFGDGAVDIEVLSSLYKTQVFQLAEYLGIPQKIIDKTPSADILPGLNDEFNLGISYAVLDSILFGIESGWSEEQMLQQLNIETKTFKKVKATLKSADLTKNAPILIDIEF